MSSFPYHTVDIRGNSVLADEWLQKELLVGEEPGMSSDVPESSNI